MSILVNCVGVGWVRDITDIPKDEMHQVLSCNVESMVFMTQQIVKSFATRWQKNKKRSLLVNVSSLSSVAPNYFGCFYAASKRFVDGFSWTIQGELPGVDACVW